MPTYTYECPSCGERRDEFHAMSAKPRVKCNKCAKICKRMLGTGSGIIFKGSGFYETDYKNKGKASAGDSESKSADSKPAESTTSTGDNSSSSDKKADKPKKDTKSTSAA